MNAEIRTASRFEEADFGGEQSKSMVVGIDDLPVKSMAALREYFDHRFEAIDHHFGAIDRRFDTIDRRFDTIDRRFDTLESLLRSIHARLNVVIGIQFALAGLLVAALAAVLFGGR